MAKHKVTVRANGLEYIVDTDADQFSVGEVMFNFLATVNGAVSGTAQPQDVHANRTSYAKFLGAQTTARKIACIKAVRVATRCDLRIAKNCVETFDSFAILPEYRVEFERECREYNLIPTYL